MSYSPQSQINFYSTKSLVDPKATFIKKSHSVAKSKKPGSSTQQEPGAEFRITLEGWRHPADDQEFDEFMDDSNLYRSPPKRTPPIRVVPSNSSVRNSHMERAYSSLREDVKDIKIEPIEKEKIRTRNRELSLEARMSSEEPKTVNPVEVKLRREESRLSRQAEQQVKKENREEYRSIPQIEISFNKEGKEPKTRKNIQVTTLREEKKDDSRALRPVETTSKLINSDEFPNQVSPGKNSDSKPREKQRHWMIKKVGQEEEEGGGEQPKLQIQNLVIQKFERTTSSVAKSYEKPQWPVRGAIRLDKLIKNESAGIKSDKHYALFALNPPKATTIQVNFEKKPSASQLAIFEKFQILHKEAQEKEKEKEKYYLEHNSPNFLPTSKNKMTIMKLEPSFEPPRAPIKYVHKIKTASIHSAQSLSSSALEQDNSPPMQSKPVVKSPKRRNVVSMSLDKTMFEQNALDQMVKAILHENPPAGASLLNKTKVVASRKDIACFNDYANRTGDMDIRKTTLTPLSSYKIIAEARSVKGVSPKSVTKETSKIPQNTNGFTPKLQSQIEQIWTSIKNSSGSQASKRQTDRFGNDRLDELNQIMTMTRSVVGDKSSSLLDPKIDINEWTTIFAPAGRKTGRDRGRRSGEDLFSRETSSNLLGKKDLSCPKISSVDQKESL